jgi:hypothetical protein
VDVLQAMRAAIAAPAGNVSGDSDCYGVATAILSNLSFTLLLLLCSADSHGRYELAMQLLRSGQACPWSVLLRRGLPATFSRASSTIYNAEHDGDSSSSAYTAGGKHGAGKGNGVTVTKGGDNGFGAYTGLSRMRVLLEGGAAGNSSSSNNNSSNSSSSNSSSSSPMASSGSAADLQSLQQPGAAAAAGLGGGPGILLDRKVMGGYVWQLSLVVVPWPEADSFNSSCSLQPSAAAAAESFSISSSSSGGSAHEKVVQSKRLCLSVVCRPAWANVLDETNPEYDPTAVSHDSAAAAAALDGQCAGLMYCGGQQQQQQQQVQRCVTCDALWTIAGAKTAEAVARHTPLMQQLLPAAAAGPGFCSCSCSSTATAAAPEAAAAAADAALGDPMQMCEHASTAVAAAAAAMVPASAGSSSSSWASAAAALPAADSCSSVEVPGICCSKQGSCSSSSSSSDARVVHLDVVVGIQLVAAASHEQLQQQVGTSSSTSSSQSPAVSHVPCLLLWDAAAGAARALVPIDIAAIGSGENVLGWCRPNGAAASGAVPAAGMDLNQGAAAEAGRGVSNRSNGVSNGEVGVLSGWQLEVWSALAPSGALYWHASLRPLMD